MLRLGCPLLPVLVVLLGLALGACSKPGADPRLRELEERVRRSEEQLAISRSEVASLKGQVDTLQNRIGTAETTAPEPSAFLGPEVRFPVAPPAPEPAPAPLPRVPEPAPAPEPIQSIPPIQPDGTAPAKPAAPRKEGKASAAARDAKAEYDKALSLLLKTGDSESARATFRTFLASHAGHSLEPNATYWLGESYYVERRFPEAVLVFKDVVDRFPAHPKAADALLKIAYAYQGLGDAQNARFHLKMLASEYPGTDAARKAKYALGASGE
jgi:tol-pal system protein YbgF